MKTIYVRPGTHRYLCAANAYFGSGACSVSLRTSGTRHPESRGDGGDNGFIQWRDELVTLAAGEYCTVSEWYHPGGSRETRYEADRGKWREQRRSHLIALIISKNLKHTRDVEFAQRASLISRNIHSAVSLGRHYEAACWLSHYLVEIARRCNFGAPLRMVIRWELNEDMLRYTPAEYHEVIPWLRTAMRRRDYERRNIEAARKLP